MDHEIVHAFFYGFGIYGFLTVYAIPCALFFILYGLVIIAFHRRQKSDMASSRVIDKAASELTKTAIVVTSIFIVSVGIQNWYYVLGNSKVVTYEINGPVQKVTLCLSAVNSGANPFVYGMLVPAYRKSLQQTFCKCLSSGSKQRAQSNTA